MSGSLPGADPTALPKYDFANSGTLQGLLEQFRRHLLRNTDDCLPATILTYNRTANVAFVQPSILTVTTDKTLVAKAAPAAVPVLALGGGGFCMNFPLVTGSRGWIKACDRDISLYLQASAAAAPNSKLLHSFSNGFFIPDVVNGFTINSADANALVIQNSAGTVRMAMDTEFRFTVPGHTLVFGPSGLVLDGIIIGTHIHTGGTLTGGVTGPWENP